jgi:hypothetical protein
MLISDWYIGLSNNTKVYSIQNRKIPFVLYDLKRGLSHYRNNYTLRVRAGIAYSV